MTTEQFIEKAIKKHGDKFDYSKVIYVNCRIPIIVACKKHGDFTCRPEKHLAGRGCCHECHKDVLKECYPNFSLCGTIVNNLLVESYSHREGRNFYFNTICQNCGNKKKHAWRDLIKHGKKKTRDAGCSKCHQLPKGQAGLNILYGDYRRHAEKKNRDFCLLLDQFREITQQNCYYCGISPSSKKTAKRRGEDIDDWGMYVFNGIDRKDNSIGYIVGNCLPCCATCNNAKKSMLFEDFTIWINRLVCFNNSKIKI